MHTYSRALPCTYHHAYQPPTWNGIRNSTPFHPHILQRKQPSLRPRTHLYDISVTDPHGNTPVSIFLGVDRGSESGIRWAFDLQHKSVRWERVGMGMMWLDGLWWGGVQIMRVDIGAHNY